KLIEKKDYNRLKRTQMIILLVTLLPIGFVSSFYEAPNWLTIVFIGIYAVLLVLMIKSQRQMMDMTNKRFLELDQEEIRIKSTKNQGEECIQLGDVQKLIVKENYSIPQEDLKEIANEVKGNLQANYLVVQQEGKKRKLDFELDSYYMLTQLNKMIELWRKKGYKIERVA
ncbi:MAG: hypothetical protein AAFO82_07925, partial [Bacteroidota bacterium]